jgi:hypothetical protein
MDKNLTVSLTIGRRGARLIAMAALILALAVPVAVVASDAFTDVPDSNTFHDDITALLDRGLTTGCGGGKFCPADNVTRGQMAAFMNRLFKAQGTALGYASIESDGTVSTGYARNLGEVAVTHTLAGYYQVNFGDLPIGPDQVIIVQPRETFGNEVCRVFQGTAVKTTVEVFCHTVAAGSPAVNIAFNVVVYN